MKTDSQIISLFGNQAQFFAKRLKFSQNKIEAIKRRLETNKTLQKQDQLCVYITGSFGRGEASTHSDLDIFFVYDDESQEQNKISDIDFTVIKADIIKITRDLGFPEFSRDGSFLHLHYLSKMKDLLGSPDDDYSNCFTARMLLLLESKAVFNKALYQKTMKSLVGSYYRDYHVHRHGFVPLFLLNDIQRYWRTMCLNYEHVRNRRSEDPQVKGRNHLKNLKLKFSRMMTCFSGIVPLSQPKVDFSEDMACELFTMRPIERLCQLAKMKPTIETSVTTLISEYAWFLDAVAKPGDEVVSWILDSRARVEAFKHADCFGDAMFDIITSVTADSNRLRYLIV